MRRHIELAKAGDAIRVNKLGMYPMRTRIPFAVGLPDGLNRYCHFSAGQVVDRTPLYFLYLGPAN
jgi:hypothetical protein